MLATQTLWASRPRTMAVTVDGTLPPGVSPKDLILTLISKIGITGAQGHILEYRGEAISQMSVEGRMTICNMTAEAGGRAGLVAPDQKTFNYVAGRPYAPRGEDWSAALAAWRTLHTDAGATFDTEIRIDGGALSPWVTWGTNPGQGTTLDGLVPDPDSMADPDARDNARRALTYMDLAPGTRMRDIEPDVVFIGSCTNSRIEDLREVARIWEGRRKSLRLRVMVVPGSAAVRAQAEAEGLGEIFKSFGAEWRRAGCSMCVGMNPDSPGEGARTVSTSNRNFEGRQGVGVRTHLASPSSAAASAVLGHLASVTDL